ncbi:hypothetical protein AB0M83_41345 [Amycolatopsis sp. NPDC051106]|uniref:hypothetical protein n=1 Tax=unclassified Amycolatopsis TaxID=2618356 RepID=UPI003420ABCB
MKFGPPIVMLGDQTEIGRCAEESLSAAAVFVLPEIREMSAVMAMSVFLVITGNHLFGGGAPVLPGVDGNGQR